MLRLHRLSVFILRVSLTSASLVSALVGCSASGNDHVGRPNGGGGSAGSVGSWTNGGASYASTTGAGSAGNGAILDVDAGSTPNGDATPGCARLNIGILGNPGSNGSSNFEQWLTKAGTSVQRIQTTPDEPMTDATLEPFDAVVLDCLTRDYSADEVATFAAWVSAGGGVAAMSGYHDDTMIDWRANSLLAPLGIAFSGSPRRRPVA